MFTSVTRAHEGEGSGPQSSAAVWERAEVFISYGRRPPGDRPDANADPAAVRRWRARTLALNLGDALENAITAVGYQPWRDVSALTGGDQFADRIDAALLSCAGAVILLDHDTLERSSWVRWESAILTWRQRVDAPVRVVPVFIGVTTEELEQHGYEPSRIDRTQSHVINPAVMDPDSLGYSRQLKKHASQIVEALGQLEGEARGDISRWANRIAACLPADCDSWRTEVAEKLLRGERLRLSAEPRRLVARELLAADRNRFERIMNAFYGYPFADGPKLKLNLEPVWVPADTATGISVAKEQDPGKRIIAVNAMEPETGADVVRRAFPLASGRQRLQCTMKAVTVEDAVKAAKEAITGKWGADPGSRTDNLGGGFVLVAGDGCPPADLARIVAALAAAYPSLTYVVMVGAAQLPEYRWLEPALPPEADLEARGFDTVLDDFISPA